MMKAGRFIFVPFALGIVGTASVALAQEPVQLKFSRVVDLTLPIETNMAGIPGFKIYADKALEFTSFRPDPEATEFLLHTFRKLSALGVAAMEQHGVRERPIADNLKARHTA